MDPEDLREVISAYQKYVADTVQRFGGFVAKYMGDGEKTVWAGLELIQAVCGSSFGRICSRGSQA
jgi:class 3 adenylate cyclase